MRSPQDKDPEHTMPPATPVYRISFFASGLVLVSTIAASAGSLASRPPSWFLLGFEICILVASVFGVLIARGHFRDGPALALVCVAGIVAFGSLLGYLGAGRRLVGFDLRPFLMARMLAATIIAGCAAWIVLSRRPRQSFALLTKGIVLGMAFGALVAGMWILRAPTAAWSGPVRTVAALVLATGCLGLFAASVHFVIRAFETGRMAGNAVDES